MTSRIPLPRLALCFTLLATFAVLAAAPRAHAWISDAPCSTEHRIVKRELWAKVNGRDAMLGKVYVFDEGRYLCAVTTSVGTLFWDFPKHMEIKLTVGGVSEEDSDTYSKYAGRIRMRDNGKCVTVSGKVELPSGADDDVKVKCAR